jgi:hypothetical protein
MFADERGVFTLEITGVYTSGKLAYLADGQRITAKLKC